MHQNKDLKRVACIRFDATRFSSFRPPPKERAKRDHDKKFIQIDTA